MLHGQVPARIVVADLVTYVLPAILASLLQLLAVLHAVGPILAPSGRFAGSGLTPGLPTPAPGLPAPGLLWKKSATCAGADRSRRPAADPGTALPLPRGLRGYRGSCPGRPARVASPPSAGSTTCSGARSRAWPRAHAGPRTGLCADAGSRMGLRHSGSTAEAAAAKIAAAASPAATATAAATTSATATAPQIRGRPQSRDNGDQQHNMQASHD